MARPRLTIPGTGAKPPTDELGSSGNVQGSIGGGVAAWSAFADTKEYVPDLIWPNSVRSGGTFDQMRTDSQLAALFFGITMPIRRYRWLIDPNGADRSMVEQIATDLNLDIVGEDPRPRRRTKNRFSHDNHLRKSLLGLIYGHMFFEQIGYIGDAVSLPADGLWHLRKLAERMPGTIQQINVAPDGGLVSIKQWGQNAKEIPVDRLIAYSWENDGGNWVGRSIFRDVYKNWLIKDRLLRIDAINHERAGGVPMPIAGEDATDDDLKALNELAQDFRIGESSGGALPSGTKWQMVKSTNSQVIESIRYHDESMARRVLMMIAMLAQGGTSLGSYSLGEVFSDFFSLGQEAIANWYRDTTQDHLIEDYVDWNWGPQVEEVPLLVYERDADPNLSIEQLVSLIDAKALLVDQEMEEWLRKKFKLPKSGTPREDPQPVDEDEAPSPTSETQAAELGAGELGTGSAPSLPAQPDPEMSQDEKTLWQAIKRLAKRN